MTKAEIENYLQNEALLRITCVRLVERMRSILTINGQLDLLWTLNRYTADEYVEMARKNLKEKLSKM